MEAAGGEDLSRDENDGAGHEQVSDFGSAGRGQVPVVGGAGHLEVPSIGCAGPGQVPVGSGAGHEQVSVGCAEYGQVPVGGTGHG